MAGIDPIQVSARGETARLLLIADTHLGIDLPQRPRVDRRRRGHDFYACYERALQPALDGEVDLVIHGGDLLYRSRVHAGLVADAFLLLHRIADAGTAVVLTPGNHERGAIPFPLLAVHPNVHIFHSPRTFRLQIRAMSLALSGFPFESHARAAFPTLVQRTRWSAVDADVRLLCIHQAVEGATVGPANFMFRNGDDVVRCTDLPSGFAAILAGHIHRHQVLEFDLDGQPLPAPVIYPGSIERTSFAERGERKGYMLIDVARSTTPGGSLQAAKFVELPARPMLDLRLECATADPAAIRDRARALLSDADPDAVVRLSLTGPHAEGAESHLSAAWLRANAPATMSVKVGVVGRSRPTRQGST